MIQSNQPALNQLNHRTQRNIESKNRHDDDDDDCVNKKLKKHQKSTKLNADILYLIFEELDIPDLLKISEIIESFASIAVHVFRRQYKHHEVAIVFGRKVQLPIHLSDTRILINEIDASIPLLRQFGSVIQRLSIVDRSSRFSIEMDHMKILMDAINDHCTTSLIALDLKNIDENVLEQLTNLTNVEKFSCRIDSIAQATPPLNQMFPKLNELALTVMLGDNCSFIDCELPYLKMLFVRSWTGQCQSHFEGLIRKNPQIEEIDVPFLSPDLLNSINNLLPNLKKLTIEILEMGNNVIHLNSVKSFNVATFDSLEAITFSHLKEFRVFYKFERLEDLIHFLQKNMQLERLTLLGYANVRDSATLFERLELELPNLIEITINEIKHSINMIVNFIQNHTKLQRFYIIPFASSEAGIFAKILGNEWLVHNQQKNVLFMEKINID